MATNKSTAAPRARANDGAASQAPSERVRLAAVSEDERKKRASAETKGKSAHRTPSANQAPENLAERALREGRKEALQLKRREERIRRELERRGIDPNSRKAMRYRDRFLRPASAVNVAFLQAALLETQAPGLLERLMVELDESFMRRRLDDEWYFGQDEAREAAAKLGVANYGYLQMQTRIFIAGMLAGRDEERRRQHVAKSGEGLLP